MGHFQYRWLVQENLALHVVAAIIVQGSRVLACRRASHKAAPGKWEFPGGKVDLGEGSHDALVREIKEELGLDCQAIRTYDISDTPVGNQTIRLETVICKIPLIPYLASTDHDGFIWLLPGEISSLDWAEPDLPAVQRLSLLGAFESLLE
ncbi:MAG: hypothetical protein RLZZ471_678 [Actinomycetota bacterium]|jgi:8-oxo-dGTP diphosphatase